MGEPLRSSAQELGRTTVFLDRDGVINEYRSDYVRVREDFVYYPFTQAAFERFGSLDLQLCVITNQSGIARGYSTAEDVEWIHARLGRDAEAWGAPIAAIEICPHLPSEGCRCRKPGPEMFERAAAAAPVRFETSFMVGDAPSDMEAGRRLGLTTIRVRTGRGAESIVGESAPDFEVENLLEAAQKIAELLAKTSRD